MNISSLQRQPVLVSILCATFLLAACGGGGGSGGDGGDGGGNNGGENQKPSVSVVFPPAGSLFTGDELVVRGTTSDDSGVQSVTVNGVAATSSDGFATWLASIPVDAGDNLIDVVVEDDDGETTEAESVDVTAVELPLLAPTGIELDVANNRAIVLDSTFLALFAIDLDSGARTVLSSRSSDQGPMLTSGLNLDINSAGTKAYVADYDQQSLFEIDLETGQRTVLSSPTLGTGPIFNDARDIAVDSVNGRSFVVEFVGYQQWNIYEVDHATGNRRIASSESVGSGDLMPYAFGVDWDDLNSRLVVSTIDPEMFFVDPDTGNRTRVLLDNMAIWTYDADYDPVSNIAYVVDGVTYQVYAVDMSTGSTSAISGDASGSGTNITSANALAYDPANNRLLVADLDRGIVAVDESTFARTTFSGNDDVRAGSGEVVGAYSAVTVDTAGGKTYAIDTETNTLVTIDLATGARATSDGDLGHSVEAMVADTANNRLLGMGEATLYSIDKTTGAATALGTMSTIMPAYVVAEMVVDAAGNRMFFATYSTNGISEVSLDTFLDEKITGGGIGSGEALRGIGALAHDSQRNRLLVMDTVPSELKSVDLASGDRTDLVNSGDTSTPRLIAVTNMEVGASGNIAYALAGRGGNLISINLDTMSRNAVAGVGTGSTADLGYSRGLGVDEEAGLAWAMMSNALIMIDMIGGDYVIISR